VWDNIRMRIASKFYDHLQRSASEKELHGGCPSIISQVLNGDTELQTSVGVASLCPAVFVLNVPISSTANVCATCEWPSSAHGAAELARRCSEESACLRIRSFQFLSSDNGGSSSECALTIRSYPNWWRAVIESGDHGAE
jgi:hypothetical protein